MAPKKQPAIEYAIVNIETTGGYASGSSITEIAIRIFGGDKVIDSYDTLVKPEQNIPLYITALTGIDYDMVCDSPAFSVCCGTGTGAAEALLSGCNHCPI